MDFMMKWSPETVAEKILELTKDKCAANAFLEQCINGEAFFELTDEDIKDLQIKLGPRKIITKYISQLKNTSTIIPDDSSINIQHQILQERNTKQNVTFISPEDTATVISDVQVYAEQCPMPSVSTLTSETESVLHFFSRYGTVENTLEKHAQGGPLLKAARTGVFNESDRKALVRIVVAELISAYNNNYYPPDKAKISLANAIVSEFPLLKNNMKDCKGYEHYYDPKTKQRFIEYRLWTVRIKLSPEKKKYYAFALKRKAQCLKDSSTVESSDRVLLDEDILEEKISWMMHKLPSDSNKESIKRYLEETFANRRQWILETGPTISQIFEKYPRLLDYRGEMIEQDFCSIYPDYKDNFLAKFPSFYANKILGYVMQWKPDIIKKTSDLAINDDALRALISLTLLLPPSNSSRRSSGGEGKENLRKKGSERNIPIWNAEVPNPLLIKFVPEGTNLPYTENQIRTETKKNVQPYIICMHGPQVTTFFVQGDGWFTTLPHRITPLAAFDFLFKLYHVLHVSYPSSLSHFYNFIASFIYELKVKPSSISSSLYVNICNVEVTELSIMEQ